MRRASHRDKRSAEQRCDSPWRERARLRRHLPPHSSSSSFPPPALRRRRGRGTGWGPGCDPPAQSRQGSAPWRLTKAGGAALPPPPRPPPLSQTFWCPPSIPASRCRARQGGESAAVRPERDPRVGAAGPGLPAGRGSCRRCRRAGGHDTDPLLIVRPRVCPGQGRAEGARAQHAWGSCGSVHCVCTAHMGAKGSSPPGLKDAPSAVTLFSFLFLICLFLFWFGLGFLFGCGFFCIRSKWNLEMLLGNGS